MTGLIVNIGWAEFIGIVSTIIGSLIAITWSVGDRFSRIESRISVMETNIGWLKESIRKIEETLEKLVARSKF